MESDLLHDGRLPQRDPRQWRKSALVQYLCDGGALTRVLQLCFLSHLEIEEAAVLSLALIDGISAGAHEYEACEYSRHLSRMRPVTEAVALAKMIFHRSQHRTEQEDAHRAGHETKHEANAAREFREGREEPKKSGHHRRAREIAERRPTFQNAGERPAAGHLWIAVQDVARADHDAQDEKTEVGKFA